MRLIKLKIKNIASLKNEHYIDFSFIQNQAPLFAITGETGAGKSTILNAIGLVLYGKIYKNNVNQNDVVTLGEREGLVELIFQSKGKKYLAIWKTKTRKQNGEFYSTPQPPQRELYSIDGDHFECQKSILSIKIEDLLNLDFDQFCKCIVLNQGEFAKFLGSSFTERKEILEKMYPGEILDSLSSELKKEKDILEKQISDIDIELHTINGDGPPGEELISQAEITGNELKLHNEWWKALESMNFHAISLQSYHTKHCETGEKIILLKETLKKETSIFNVASLESQKAKERLHLAQEDQDKRRPELQKLLKAEEAYKIAQIQLADIEKHLIELSQRKDEFSTKEKAAKSSLKSLNAKSLLQSSNFHFPFEEIKFFSNTILEIIDLFTQMTLIELDISNKNERLKQLEAQGREEANSLNEIKTLKSSFDDEKSKLMELEVIKSQELILQEKRQISSLKFNELNLQVTSIKKEYKEIEKTIEILKEKKERLEQEHIPIKATIELQALLNAVQICLNHPKLNETGSCPVCETTLNQDKINSLKKNIEKTDVTLLNNKDQELQRLIFKTESEIQNNTTKNDSYKRELLIKEKEAKDLEVEIKTPINSLDSLEQELKEIQKKVWTQEEILKSEDRINLNLNKTRVLYSTLKTQLLKSEEALSDLSSRISELAQPMKFLTILTPETIKILKLELTKLNETKETQNQIEKTKQEIIFIEKNLKDAEIQFSKNEISSHELKDRIQVLGQELQQKLSTKSASDVINEINQQIKDLTELSTLKESELKAIELKLKDSQSRLNTLDELMKDVDLHFYKELQAVKECAKVQLPSPTTELTILLDRLINLSLRIDDQEALFISLKELTEGEKNYFKDKTSEIQMKFASLKTRLEDWEKRQDRVALLTLKSREMKLALDRRTRLYEVLGKDELRTFVLSLVEENLIIQTNEELQKLCQGRYEIVHQSRRSKMTPEFYILDKFRDGGLRKVSTLSGGETFMVSLAMALGLAEMTRGKAEIETLFIDEGFGTLDQDSLEDVLDMLKQIQTRGLMVGVISHVKGLTQSLPVNLLVLKKQDGTSSLNLVFN
jgi:exonuclease SbcC